MVIGLPQGLLYYRYGALWQTFFNELGIETVLSGPTDRRIMDAGYATVAFMQMTIFELGPCGGPGGTLRLCAGPPGQQFRAAPQHVYPL